MTLTNFAHVTTIFALNFTIQDIIQYLFGSAITQWEFCMEANADIFLEQIAFDNFCKKCFKAVNVAKTTWMWF